MNLPSAPLHLTCVARNPKARTAVDLALEQAVLRSLRADAPVFERLPVPVRYRAAGAIQAWSAARKAAGREGEQLSAMLADPHCPPLDLLNRVGRFVEKHSTLDFKAHDGPAIAAIGSLSVWAQTFWQRGGAVYEPTPALHRLLDATDIADNVPVRLLCTPSSAMCIVPDPSGWDQQGGVESIAVFTHHGTGADAASRYLTFIAWSHWTDPQARFGTEMLTLEIGDEDVPIGQALEAAVKKPPAFSDHFLSDVQSHQRWRTTLNYVVKMLLYLSLDSTQVIHERPFSTALRVFPGLGKRKRELKLAQIDLLYDRYAVGPSVLGDELSSMEGHSGHSVSAHWRRGHFRLQPHGPHSSLRKLLFIMPMMVRADRLVEAGAMEISPSGISQDKSLE
jgi:hypothetical protein